MRETRKQKILFVITKSNFGGAQRYVYELATHLPKDQYEVVVAFGGAGLLKTKLEEAGVRTRTIASFERDINFKKEIEAFRELRTILREELPDIVHLNSSKAGGVGALASRLAHVPRIIFTAHGWPFFEKRSILWRNMAWALSWVTTLLAHTVIVVSAHDLKRARMYGLSSKLAHIYISVPSISFLSREDARAHLFPLTISTMHRDDTWLVTIAEHTSNKNILKGIEAVAEHNATHEKKIFYTLIGEGELTKSLQDYVRTHGLENSVFFAGYVENARAYLKAFDAFILPSTKEGFPYTLLEAGLAEVPCIASNVGGIPELIKDDHTGMLVDPHSTQSLTNALTKVVSDEAGAHMQAETLHKKILSDFTIDTMLQKTIALYSS